MDLAGEIKTLNKYSDKSDIKYRLNVTIQKAVFREVFFVNIVHRKPETCGAKSCKA